MKNTCYVYIYNINTLVIESNFQINFIQNNYFSIMYRDRECL